MSRVAAVVPAAGSGSRMGGAPKQFRLLGGAPVLVQTLRALRRGDDILEVVVAVRRSERDSVEETLRDYDLRDGVRVVAGGATRLESVLAACAASTEEAEVLIVHDAVRPFLSKSVLNSLISAVETRGAAAVAIPIADTLRQAQDGQFGDTVDRDGMFAMQTPQGARREVLLQALQAASDAGVAVTDEVEALRRLDIDVRLVVGDPRNQKLTHPADWRLAEALWPAWVAEEGV